MALGGLPPWVSVNPSDFVHAAASGAALGHAIADSKLRAWEEQARMRMASQAHQDALAQQQVENAMTRLAADRLEAYRQSEIANRQKELGIQQQGLGLRGESVDIARQRVEDQRQRNDDLYNLREDAMKARSGREADLQAFRDATNQFKEREADRRDKEMERREKEFDTRQSTLQPHYFQGPDGKQYMIPRGATNAVEIPLSPLKKDETDSSGGNLLSRLPSIAESVLTGNAINDYLNRSKVQPPKTNAVPAVGLSYAPQETQAAPPPAPATPAAPKKRVRVKGPSGQTGTVEEGDALPDGWKVAE